MKRISPVLGSENAEQEAVHHEDDAAQGESSDLLSLRIRHTGHFERKSDGGE